MLLPCFLLPLFSDHMSHYNVNIIFYSESFLFMSYYDYLYHYNVVNTFLQVLFLDYFQNIFLVSI